MMPNASSTDSSGKTTPRSILLADHARLDGLMMNLLACVEQGDAPSVVAPWWALESGLRAHMLAEEAELFPAFTREHGPEVTSLMAEHDKIRAELDRLGLQVELHECRIETIRVLIERIRAHAATEERTFYPWVDGWAPASFLGTLRSRLERTRD